MVGRNVSHFSCSVLNISKKHCPTILLYDSLGKLQVISFITLECKMTVNFHLLSIKQASECNELCTLNGNIHFLFTILCFWHSNILEFPLWTDWIVIHHGFIYAVWKTVGGGFYLSDYWDFQTNNSNAYKILLCSNRQSLGPDKYCSLLKHFRMKVFWKLSTT